ALADAGERRALHGGAHVQQRRHPRDRDAADEEPVEEPLVVGRDGDGGAPAEARRERVGEQVRAGVEIVARMAAADAEGEGRPHGTQCPSATAGRQLAGVRTKSRYSTLPAGPVIGDSTTPTTSQPRARAAATHLSTAAWRFSGSRTTPPLPTSPLPTSNCGLTSAMMGFSPPPTAATSVGRTSVSEMKL